MRTTNRQSLYGEVTARIIADLEQGRLPWVQPWDAASCPLAMPHNAASGRGYSGINILILWAAVVEQGFTSQRIRRGSKCTTATFLRKLNRLCLASNCFRIDL